MVLTIAQIAAWIAAGQQLVAVGVATAENIKTWIKALHPDLSDADLNAILDAIVAGASRHKALADADAG